MLREKSRKSRPASAAARYRSFSRRRSETLSAKNSTAPKFFRNSRVSSCRKIKMKNGKPVAVPFRLSKKCLSFGKNLTKAQRDESTKSIYQPKTAAGSMKANFLSRGRKPLVKYHPSHPRNRLKEVDYPPINALSSKINLGNYKFNERNWKSEYKTRIGNFIRSDGYSNPGILKRMHKWHQHQLSKKY